MFKHWKQAGKGAQDAHQIGIPPPTLADACTGTFRSSSLELSRSHTDEGIMPSLRWSSVTNLSKEGDAVKFDIEGPEPGGRDHSEKDADAADGSGDTAPDLRAFLCSMRLRTPGRSGGEGTNGMVA